MHRTLFRSLCISFVLVILCATSASLAQTTATDRAKQLNEEGKTLFGAGNYDAAIEKFREAFELSPISNHVFNLAYAYLNTGKNAADARNSFLKFLELCRAENDGKCPDESRVQLEIQRLEDVLFRELPRVTIQSEPQGALIFLTDPATGTDRIIGQTPHSTKLAQGTYNIRIETPGYEPLSTKFDVQRIGDLNLSFPLTKFRNIGAILVNANVRGARIYIDGKVYGLSPRKEPLEVEAGQHQVIVEKDGYTRDESEVTVQSGQTVSVNANIYLESTPATWRSYLGWPLAVVGVLGIGAGITFWQLADQEFQNTPTFDDYVLYQNLGYGIGGGLLAVGTALIIWEYAAPAVDSGDLVTMPSFGVMPDGTVMAGIGGKF